MRTKILALGCLAWLALSSPGLGYAAPGGPVATCQPINSAPATISSSGTYCLSKDLSTSINGENDAAILIDASDVVLDLNQHVVDGSSAGLSTLASGILAVGRHNVTVRNGTIKGFRIAIFLKVKSSYEEIGGNLVTGVRTEGSALEGIEVQGLGNRVVDNLVLNTGGGASPADDVTGIGWNGPDARILGNDIIDVHNATDAWTWGIATGGGDSEGSSIVGSIVEGNRISDLSTTASSQQEVIGIGPGEFANSVTIDGTVIAGNTIASATIPAGSTGHAIKLGAGALCRDNTIFKFPGGIGSCTDGNGNVMVQ